MSLIGWGAAVAVATGATLAGAGAGARTSALGAPGAPGADSPYFAAVDVRPGTAPADGTVRGVVFFDRNRNGKRDADEKGLAGVKVSNGREVVETASDGRYSLPVRDDMAVFVIQPSGWRVPTDSHFVPQFSYAHKPAGSPKKLRYGGLPPTGPLPAAIDFPLIPSQVGKDFSCAVLGDVQVYSGDEIGYARDSIVRDLQNRGARKPACILTLGDNVGDDLGLIPRLETVMGSVGVPQWWVQGNHDYDSDADNDADSSDTWRHLYGPNYYAFEVGRVLFIVLDNVVYPCGPEDDAAGTRPFCSHDPRKTYNGRIPDDQMRFVANLLAHTDPGKLVVVAHHIPLVGFDNRLEWAHQTDNANALYALLKGRKALDLSGHSHTLENLAPGDSFEGWQKMVAVAAIPFRHVVAGAVAGDWWGGDYDVYGIPMSLQGCGAPRGYIDMAVADTDYTLDYRATGLPQKTAMWLSVNTPEFRSWAEKILAWRAEDRQTRDPVPPLSVQDLPDVKLLTPDDLAANSWLTANVWLGDSTTEVTVSIDGGAPVAMTRTQQAKGEASREGVYYADPFALQRQLTVARTAIRSRSGNPETQGFIQGRQVRHPPAPPQPQGALADHNSHLWRYALPTNLSLGVHTARVRATRSQGETATDVLTFEVRPDRPAGTFRWDAWKAFQDGPRVQ